MTRPLEHDAFDRFLGDWLVEEAGVRTPGYLGETLMRLDGVSQRRARASLERWLPMSVITARPTGTTRDLTSVGIVLALSIALITGLIVVASQVLRDESPDPRTMSAFVPTLVQDEGWDASTIPGLDEPILGDIGPDGNLYVLNGGTNEVFVVSPSGELVDRIGERKGERSFDVQAWPEDPYGFSSMGDVAVGPDGRVYVTDKVNDRIVRYGPGPGSGVIGSYGPNDSEFLDPIGLAVGADGRVYVYDSQRKDTQVFDPDGTYLETIAQRTADDGTMLVSGRLAIADDGSSVVAGFANEQVQRWAADGTLRWLSAVPRAGDEFSEPRDVDVDAAGDVIVADTAIRILGPDGTIRSEWIPDVEPTEIGLGPMFVVAAPDGSVYVSLQLYDTIRKFHVVESELVEDTVSSTAAPSHAPTLPAGSSPRPIAVETTSFDRFKVPFTLDLPATWHTQDQGLGIVNVGEDQPSDGGAPIWVLATVVENVFTDPCHPTTSAMDPPLGPSVDDLVTAMTNLEGFRSGPVTDVELDGHSGRVFDLENSIDSSACEGAPWLPQMTFERVPGVIEERGPAGEFHQKVYVLDVDGQRVLVESWSFGDTTRENVIEVDEVLRSIDFE